MAGEWIKVECSTEDKPEVVKMARILKKPRRHVLGSLVAIWCWFDRNSVDGAVDGFLSTDIDEIAALSGFAGAMMAVGWLCYDDTTQKAVIPHFARHNGESAKKRALKNERQARWRSTSPSTQPSTPTSTSASTREEKNKEDLHPPTPLKGGSRKERSEKGTPGWWETPAATFDEAKRLGLSTRGIDWPQLKADVRQAHAKSTERTHARNNGSTPVPELDPEQGFPVKRRGKFDDEPEQKEPPSGT